MIHINPQTLTVTRTGAQTIVNYQPVQGASTTFTITATVQPLTGRERQDLPEGYRAANLRKMYTTADLNVISVEAQTYSDTIALEDGTYEVFAKENRQSPFSDLSHYKYTLLRVGADEG